MRDAIREKSIVSKNICGSISTKMHKTRRLGRLENVYESRNIVTNVYCFPCFFLNMYNFLQII